MTSDIAIYEGGQVDGYRPQIMTPEAARALDEQVRLCTRAVLREGTDYGVIPGTGGEKSLWRPGAQKLLQWFSLECTCERVEVERDEQGRKHGITYRAEVGRGLKTATPVILATCEGTADYDESKFYQSAEQVKERLRALENKYAAKDGRRPNPERWMNATEFRADWNSLMKRAQKRAIVGAVNDATGAGGIFSDREEDDPPVPQAAAQDDGPSWYEQALEQALTFTTQEDGKRLWAEAAHAGRDGLASRRQVDHVQNRIRQRAERFKRVIPVDVEDLADAAAAHAAAEESQDVPPADVADDAGGTRKGSGMAGLIVTQFERLGVTDRNDRLILTAQLARLDDIPSTTSKLTARQQRDVLKALEKCRDGDALQALLAAGERDAEGGERDE